MIPELSSPIGSSTPPPVDTTRSSCYHQNEASEKVLCSNKQNNTDERVENFLDFSPNRSNKCSPKIKTMDTPDLKTGIFNGTIPCDSKERSKELQQRLLVKHTSAESTLPIKIVHENIMVRNWQELVHSNILAKKSSPTNEACPRIILDVITLIMIYGRIWLRKFDTTWFTVLKDLLMYISEISCNLSLQTVRGSDGNHGSEMRLQKLNSIDSLSLPPGYLPHKPLFSKYISYVITSFKNWSCKSLSLTLLLSSQLTVTRASESHSAAAAAVAQFLMEEPSASLAFLHGLPTNPRDPTACPEPQISACFRSVYGLRSAAPDWASCEQFDYFDACFSQFPACSEPWIATIASHEYLKSFASLMPRDVLVHLRKSLKEQCSPTINDGSDEDGGGGEGKAKLLRGRVVSNPDSGSVKAMTTKDHQLVPINGQSTTKEELLKLIANPNLHRGSGQSKPAKPRCPPEITCWSKLTPKQRMVDDGFRLEIDGQLVQLAASSKTDGRGCRTVRSTLNRWVYFRASQCGPVNAACLCHGFQARLRKESCVAFCATVSQYYPSSSMSVNNHRILRNTQNHSSNISCNALLTALSLQHWMILLGWLTMQTLYR